MPHSDDVYLKPMPARDEDGLPRCTEKCAHHDGKRCVILGHRPDGLCEPEVREMAAKLTALVGPSWRGAVLVAEVRLWQTWPDGAQRPDVTKIVTLPTPRPMAREQFDKMVADGRAGYDPRPWHYARDVP